MISKRDEQRAARLVRESIDAALSEMRDYVQRKLLAGEKPDKRMMVEMANGLARLADEYAIDLTAGPWGDMIEEAMKAGSAEVGILAAEYGTSTGTLLTVGKVEVEAALYSAGLKVKGILEDGQRIVGEEILKSIVGGKSQRDVADAIAGRLQVADEAGEMGDIPAWRAELIARNELSSNYRSVKQAAAEAAGFKYFEMSGPDDDRTNDDVCAKYLGQIHTVEEWDAIAEKEGVDPAYPLLSWGFHVNCRHDWDGVPDAIAEEALAEA